MIDMESCGRLWIEECFCLKKELNQTQVALECAQKKNFDHSQPSTRSSKTFPECVQNPGTICRVRRKEKIPKA